ncbi:ABC transporter ATP-binding protein [Echinicola rosea]|uniref:ABC transporter domain-containing protein n=1 Tax=Echinicola rosea TaxID=1807691 RepID=A0ABQ1VA95_9BACT|nr:ABC transporter ATP-binding protein [Echinicola rosea]GGF47007.1 hypothetical protein GCM10011339_39430 [Echinicola rosea]
MSKSIIKVENLSKRYRLGLKEKRSKTLAGQVGNIIKSPWENFQRLRKLSKFGAEDESVFWALKDVNFEVKEGEVLGIIGKNGAGKSTLLKILSQITEPTSGKITLNGRVASLLEVGTGFHPELTGRENIYMNGTILGMTRREIDRKLDEIIDFSGIEKFVDTPVKFYSSGMKVRLGFSVAAHLEPEILIIDEVLAVGDYEFQQKCLGKMEDVSKNQGRTVLFVSHNMAAVQNLCSRGLLLGKGTLVYEGNLEKLIEKYFSLQGGRMTNTNGSFDLSTKKKEETAITRLDIYCENKLTNIVHANSHVTFKVVYNSCSKFRATHFGVSFRDQFGDEIIAINNKHTGDVLSGVSSSQIIVDIPEFPLFKGSYELDLFLGDGFYDFDVIKGAGRIKVIEKDIYNSGFIPDSRKNLISYNKIHFSNS